MKKGIDQVNESGSSIINSTRFSDNLLSSKPLSLFTVVRAWIAKASFIRLCIVLCLS